MKRNRDEDEVDEPPLKLRRAPADDRLSRLSDELLVRILSFVSVPTLLVCQRVSRKFGRLSIDAEIWKAAYYKQFVLPKASRIPGIKESAYSSHLHYSSKLSKWLDDSDLVKRGPHTDWKQQYRLRHNWSRGKCAVSEIVIAERPADPPLLVMMHNGIVYTADSVHGLRAWDSKNERGLIASTLLTVDGTEIPQLPTSMAVDLQEDDSGSQQRVVVGFEDGSFTVFLLNSEDQSWSTLFSHPPSSNGMLSALASSFPYLLTMTEDHLLSLYAFPKSDSGRGLESPELLYSLRSHTAWPPVSLSLRASGNGITAAVAFSLPTYLSGWTVGIQEMRLSHEGQLLESRLSTATDGLSRTLTGQRSASNPSTRSSSPFSGRLREPSVSHIPSSSKPTSMSYSHPYLLASHPDNTLTLYLVRSTDTSLNISSGNRLWGHTSSVSGAHVGMRGKAVSVSRLGNELRVWDLEGGMPSSATRRRAMIGDLSVRVQPAKSPEGCHDVTVVDTEQRSGLRSALDQGFDDSTVSRGWVGFDEQNVIVLREKSEGSQALAVYDFT
ncbi:hypothetical protein BU24DRAFT_462758 [Aaosphaeria arxii CBS 175.79]|uniref:F-box domain-containing protein n=1 Tax=Aaosphaeria arxii CBS 175.79 TaxID=1450172 RepID=A0A6A5XUJ7_9PLEO|nr:uncharacterized protein BU24DRAFT_462758 [Aaosphaeria arxii CBS 175.79]KAF2016623.1 hypothetical protein BU24DRAFT_462758 [Aaosphaeria arxii CBS 175.79]